jgi:ABC-type branched-subunit amino acid transport system ATPase component
MTVQTSGPVVEVQDLTVRFGRLTAVDQVSFAVDRGEVYALLGRNGSGKSTTIRCLLGQLKASAGQVTVFGKAPWAARKTIMERVGVAPEVSDIPPEMTSRQVSRFAERLYSDWDRQSFFDRLDRFGIDPQRRFSRLSKGQRKQLGLALALSSEPDLIILDDPTLGLGWIFAVFLGVGMIGNDLAQGRLVGGPGVRPTATGLCGSGSRTTQVPRDAAGVFKKGSVSSLRSRGPGGPLPERFSDGLRVGNRETVDCISIGFLSGGSVCTIYSR